MGDNLIIEGKRNKENIIYMKIYNLWKNMMRRCYNKDFPQYKNYGGKGIYVCDRWHDLENFIKDIDKINGFNYKEYLEGKLTLDKDCKIVGNLEYALDKCTFISLEENNKYKPHQQKYIIATSPNGEIYEFFNQCEFSRIHNLRQSAISSCLTGWKKTHKGWKFKYK